MTDVLTPEQRRKNMQHIKSNDTKIEVLLRKALWEKGYRYRKNYKALPGNLERDDEINKKLLFMGWIVIRFWGNEIKKNTDECVRVIEETIFDIRLDENGEE